MTRNIVGIILTLLVTASLSWGEGPIVGQDCRLTWAAPTTNADGTPLTDLKEYRLYTRTGAGVYDLTKPLVIPQPTTQTTCGAAKVTTDGQYFAVVTAVDEAGNQGLPSPELAFVRDTTAPGQVEVFEVLEFTGTMKLQRVK